MQDAALAYEYAGGFFSAPRTPNSISSEPQSMAIRCCEAKWQDADVPGSVLLHHIIAQYQNVHARAQEAIEGLSRPVHDGLILVKRGIEEYRDARQRCKCCEE